MRYRALLLALLGFTVIACVSENVVIAQGGAAKFRDCHGGGGCTVVVTVTSCAAGGISVDAPTLNVQRGNPRIRLTWTIAGNDYEFTDDGIKFTTPGWEQEFEAKHNGKNNYTWIDINPTNTATQGRPFKYSVTVQPKRGGAACPSLDPTVINDV
jgi:hypothetical protein